MILSIPYLPSFARDFFMRIVDCRRKEVPYLAIIKNKTETSGDGLKWTEGIR